VRAIKGHNEIVLRAGFGSKGQTNTRVMVPMLPAGPFLNAAGRRFGVSHFEPDKDGIVRRHWPFPSPGQYQSLAEVAARIAGADVSGHSQECWMRYYGNDPLPWTRMSFEAALKQPPDYFHGQLVFIGVIPRESAPDNVAHKFRTPYSHWTDRSMAGTDLLITEFLNLLNGESLLRSATLEWVTLLLAGAIIGSVLPQVRFVFLTAFGFIVLVCAGSVALTSMTNYWFPWLLVVVGQLVIALVWTVTTSGAVADKKSRAPTIAGYHLVEPPIAHGAYGEVWLARSSGGQWRAVKVVSLQKFDNDAGPYDREYDGVSRYREICAKHPGLLRVECVSEKLPSHFYYIMELGDSLQSGWEKSSENYIPKDLSRICALMPEKRLPIDECVSIGITLCDTLDFIHRSGFTHRDVKPQNILFVNGRPKLADVGLITDIRSSDNVRTAVGTPGYMPLPPEMPGTPQADIYALGMVLYVISTGCNPVLFPEIPEKLLGGDDPTNFLRLNTVILKACQPDLNDRFRFALEMRKALEELRANVSAT
jgi:hypothetical protein